MDPVWARYLKLRALTPQCLRFAAPPRAGECGWKIDGGVVNWDVAIVQERLQFLYFGGVFDWLDARPRPLTVLEIGAGSGLFASAFIRARPGARYILCDLPEVLCVAFAYLNLVLPDRRHLIALPGPELVDAASGAAAAIDSSGGEVIYLPNYLVGAADRLIAPNMIVNAMSLPEMGAGQIAYYAEFMARALDRTRGIYVDINAPKGGTTR